MILSEEATPLSMRVISSPVDEVGVDEPRDGGSGRVYYLEGDLQGVDRGWDRHGLHDLIELSIKWFGAYIRFDRRTAMEERGSVPRD